MTIELIRTEEPCGNWYKILAAGGWPLRCILFDATNESDKYHEALAFFNETVKRAEINKTVVLKSIEI
jgi:hypothetical protein